MTPTALAVPFRTLLYCSLFSLLLLSPLQLFFKPTQQLRPFQSSRSLKTHSLERLRHQNGYRLHLVLAALMLVLLVAALLPTHAPALLSPRHLLLVLMIVVVLKMSR